MSQRYALASDLHGSSAAQWLQSQRTARARVSNRADLSGRRAASMCVINVNNVTKSSSRLDDDHIVLLHNCQVSAFDGL